MKDGMSREQLKIGDVITIADGSIITGVISGDNLLIGESIAGAELSEDSVTASEIAAGAVGTSEQNFVGFGSPPTYSSRVLAGSDTMPATTSKWVVFGDTFTTAPFITIGANVAGDIDVFSVNGGSFLASGTDATVFHWQAVGTA